MKIYIAYKFVGENPKELEKILNEISKVLRDSGHEVYSASQDEALFANEKFNLMQILNHALRQLDKSDCILVFVKSSEKTEGILMEVGYALAKKKKIILAIKKGINWPFTEEVADRTIEFSDINELKEKLGEIPA